MITSLGNRHTLRTGLTLLVVSLLLITWAALPPAGYSAPTVTNWYVATSGNDSYTCLTASKPCEHIQTAINRAASGDIINIAAGTYLESLTISDRNLTLKGQSAANTFLDGNSLQPVLTILRSNVSSLTVTVSDVTIQRGNASLGAGISTENNVYLTVNNSNIVSNTATYGGGIFNQGILALNNVTLRGNTANTADPNSEGGAIWNVGFINMTGVTLTDNLASRGGGISSINTLTVTNSTINNNRAIGKYGGGIYNRTSTSRLTLNNSVVSGNQAIGTDGGGIYNDGRLVSSNSVISGNLALGNGGGVFNNASGQVILSNVSFNNNQSQGFGGGFFSNGNAAFTSSFANGNQALQAGGGLYNGATGKLDINTSTVVGNTATNQEGGGISNLGALTVTQSSLTDNVASASQGGGLYTNGNATVIETSVNRNRANLAGGGLYNTAVGQLDIETSSVTSNTVSGAGGGGGIGNLGALVVKQSSLIYNVATTAQGGGLNNAGTAQLTNVTVSDNSATTGGGVQNGGGTLTIQFSTISTNTTPSLNRVAGSVSVGNSLLVQGTGNACNGTLTSADYNVDSGNSCGFAQAHDLINTNPQLGPLRDNGGLSPTRAIGFGSPAQDNGVVPCPLTVDQRGIARPQFDVCDRGAYEVAGYANPSPLDIGAGQCITSLLTINDQFAVGRLLAGVNLTYPKTGVGSRTDLTIRLLSPGSRSVRLLGPAAASGQNLDTLFDDSAAQSVPSGDQDPASPFYTPAYQPVTPLAQFIGAGVKGTWKLEVCNSGTATGTLNRWALVIPEVADFKIFMPIIRR